jgi:hypothetical protein
MRLNMFGPFVFLFILALSSPAQGFITHFKVSPEHLYTDESEVTVSWRADRALKPGYHYEGVLLDPQHERGCASDVRATSHAHVRKGKTVSLHFNSTNDAIGRIEGAEYSEWCDGKAGVSISVVKNGTEAGSGTEIGFASFRFYKKP